MLGAAAYLYFTFGDNCVLLLLAILIGSIILGYAALEYFRISIGPDALDYRTLLGGNRVVSFADIEYATFDPPGIAIRLVLNRSEAPHEIRVNTILLTENDQQTLIRALDDFGTKFR